MELRKQICTNEAYRAIVTKNDEVIGTPRVSLGAINLNTLSFMVLEEPTYEELPQSNLDADKLSNAF